MTLAELSIVVLAALFVLAGLIPRVHLGLTALPAAFLLGLIAGVPADEVTEFFPANFVVLIVGVMAPTTVLVNASGTWARPFRPHMPGAADFAGMQISTPEYRAAEDFTGQRVLVVGGGTSAVGFLHELEHVASDTLWVTRRPVTFTDAVDGRGAVREADEAARAGRQLPSIVSGTGLPATAANLAARERGLLVPRPMFTSIEPSGVRWDDGTFEPVDAIIWATGFRAELTHLAPLRLREPGGGIQVEGGRSVREPRLFLAGYGPQASTIGANRAGRTVARKAVAVLESSDADARSTGGMR